MLDIYDTRFLTQDMIDAIIEIWDSTISEEQWLNSVESHRYKDLGEDFPAFENGERGRYAVLVQS